jgi:hypothetical protein
MRTNTVMYTWKRSLPGRERESVAHFSDFVGYLTRIQGEGLIASFEPILLEPNGSGIVGFFLIRADPSKLDPMMNSNEWNEHIVRSMFHLDEPALLYGGSGAMVEQRMTLWSARIPA